jgi:DNA-binding transcriptional LysR family regulator
VTLTIVEALGFHSAEAAMRDGSVDAYIGVAPAAKLPTEFQVESLFKNQRIVIGRAGHPLAKATTLRELVDARWVLSSATTAATSFASLFRKHHCKVPARITFAGSILSQLVLLLHSDMMMVAPRQVLDFAPYKGLLTRIPIKAEIDAPEIVMIHRAASPLTPAAEHFCDLLRRASVQSQAKASARAPASQRAATNPLTTTR